MSIPALSMSDRRGGLRLFQGQEVLNHLCRIVVPMTALRNQLITEEGKIGTEMYFIVEGEVHPHRRHCSKLSPTLRRH